MFKQIYNKLSEIILPFQLNRIKQKKDVDDTIKIKPESISSFIIFLRGEKVIVDFVLARLYGVEVNILKRAVRRNIQRFPADFMFELSREEYNTLRCQFGILEKGKHAKFLPFAFTEQGVAMLSGILSTSSAIAVNIAIMRAFVQLRQFLDTHKELARKIESIEKLVITHDEKITLIFEAIKQLMKKNEEAAIPRKPIGYKYSREND